MRIKCKIFCILFGGLLILTANLAQAQKDYPESKDHPLLTRMPNFYIDNYEAKEFDQYPEFKNSQGEDATIEGRKYYISYCTKNGFKEPSEIQILRNFISAVKKIGGTLIYQEESDAYLKLEKGGKITWVHVHTWNWGQCYDLIIIEKEAMVQEIVADPKAMASDIKTTGHVAIYGIYFDLDRSVIKPESEPTLKAIAELLKTNISLKVYVVGHTDMTGTFEHNKELSSKRAEAVMTALVNKYGIAANRLAAKGAGPLCPVSTNKTEEGRKLNRRVELVEK